MKEKHEHPDSAILDTLVNSKELIADIGDVAINATIESGVVDLIPFLNWAVRSHAAITIYQKKRAQRNIASYLIAVQNCDREKLEELAEKILSDSEFREEFTDNTLAVLLEGTKPLKAEILGNLTVALAREEIDKDDFKNLSLIVIAASVPALETFQSFVTAHITEFIYFGGTKSKLRIKGQKNQEQQALIMSMGIAGVDRVTRDLFIHDVGFKLFFHGMAGNDSLRIRALLKEKRQGRDQK